MSKIGAIPLHILSIKNLEFRTISSWLGKAALPILGIVIFLGLWSVVASNIVTSLGTFPGPGAVWEQSINLVDEHVARQKKARDFYERQEERNAARFAQDPSYEVKVRDFTGPPTFFEQIWTSLYTVSVGF
jgi:nitrate/nitrite transport system permease protein